MVLFVDLKAAIDSLDRGVLLQTMRGRSEEGFSGKSGRNIERRGVE